MIKLIIEIEEEGKVQFKNKVGTNVKCSLEEIRTNATNGEKEIAYHFRNKMGINKKYDVIDKTSDKVFEEFLNSL